MKKRTKWLPALVLALAAGAGGCADTEIQGVVLDEDLNTPGLMLTLVRGVNSELTDVYRNQAGWHQSHSDDFTDDGGATTEERNTVGDFSDRRSVSNIISFHWEQILEAAWAGYRAFELSEDVFGATAGREPVRAQAMVVSGWSERLLGEMFCEVLYGFGPDGGPLLEGSGENYDLSQPQTVDSSFRRSLNAMQTALPVAEAALAAGVAAPDGDPIFDPQNLVYKARGGIAQAYANLGQWDQAVQWARQVPDDFVAYEHHHTTFEQNDQHNWHYENDDLTVYGSPAHYAFAGDPRAPWQKCGDWRAGQESDPPNYGTSGQIIRLDCDRENNEFRAESNTIPKYMATKYPDDGDDVPMIKGTEMRLIEAEAALRSNNLGEFTVQVNRARAAHYIGAADPIAQPATAGALEYPNAQDDAWSILDRERYLDMWLEGRRIWDLRRWNHPFLTEKHVLTLRLLQPPFFGYGPDIPRWQCYPVADIECDSNANIVCAPLTKDDSPMNTVSPKG